MYPHRMTIARPGLDEPILEDLDCDCQDRTDGTAKVFVRPEEWPGVLEARSGDLATITNEYRTRVGRIVIMRDLDESMVVAWGVSRPRPTVGFRPSHQPPLDTGRN